MGEKKDYTYRFMINIGNWLYEKNVISLDEVVEFKSIVEKQNKTNNIKN